MKTQLFKIATVLGFALAIFLSCTDNQPPEFPSWEEVQDARQKDSSSSEPSSSSESSSSSGDVSSSSGDVSSSSEEVSCDDAAKCNGRCYNKETQFCYNSTDIHDKCGGSNYYNIASYGCCNGTLYLLSGYGCEDNTLLTKCGESLYNPVEQFCASNGSVNYLCGGKQFDPPDEYCVEDVINGVCGETSLNYDIYFCYGGEPYTLCGGKNYDPTNQFCSGANTVEDKCGGENYDPATQFCYGTEVKEKCGGENYNPDYEFCYGTEVKDKCGGILEYIPGTESCCGSGKYAIATEFCQTGTNDVKPLCGTATYTSTEFCQSPNVVKPLCGAATYTSAQFCQSPGVVLSLCGTLTYTAAQFCQSSGVVKDLCGGVTYTTTELCCGGNTKYTPVSTLYCDSRDGRVYGLVTIGSRVWMTENLNYKTPDGTSRCYPTAGGNPNQNDDIDNTNCTNSDGTTKYGRLYNWTTATTVCPTGWLLPNKAEWDALCNNNNWSSINTSFKALINAGYCSQEGYCQNTSVWWTNTPEGTNAVRVWWNGNSIGPTTGSSGPKSDLHSVRCIQSN